MASTPRTRNRRGLVWAVVGGLVLIVAIVAILLATLPSDSPDPTPPETAETIEPSAEPTEAVTGDVVDATVVEKGWVPEPITTDPDVYIRAALAAASNFDTQLSTRAEWLAYLDSWFTPDTRYASEADRESDMQASQLELRQGVVLPEQEWDSLANEDGRVAAAVTGEIDYAEVPGDESADMRIGTADAVLTFTRATGDSGEASYDETVTVSVQVLCGEGSIPTSGTAQQSGDCKVVRYFSGSLEP